MSDPMSADNLYQLDDAPVITQVQSVFANQLQSSPSVQPTFFSSTGAPPIAPANPDWVDSVATALICDSISQSSMYGFSGTVIESAANNFWSSQLAQTSQSAIAAGRALYDWAFPTYCAAAGNTFQQYLSNNPQDWGQQLATKVSENSFINTEVNRIIAAGPNWLQKLNLILYKLHLLNDSTVQGVLNAWTTALPNQGIVLNWQTYQFIPSNLFTNTYFLSQANQAIGVGKDGQVCSTGGLGVPICDYWTDYGLAVVDFLKGKPQALGLYNGQSPANHVDSSSSGGGSCFIAGSPVHLDDGTLLLIEELRQDHRLIAKDGAVGTHTDERVIVDVDVEMPVYGFNESEPFFSAGHLFWTRDGWKAFEPLAAFEENPSRKVGKLEVGDVVFRIASLDPLTYEEVKIERFTGRLLSPGEKLYGVHMDGAHSYHVHGFCVAVNYPMITEQRLADGFATLSEAERQHVLEALTPIMPLLRKAVGRFIEKPLSRSLTGDGDKAE